MEYIAPSAPTQTHILCADCGTPIQPNSANLCLSCLRNTVDITEDIPKQATVNFCRNCERFLNPPITWVPARLESRELLAICLKKLKGLSKVRLINASFVWTEPHSKRLRVKLTVQKEVLTATILQQTFEIEYIVHYGQCPDCTRLAAKNTWRALVQVRQKVPHKRTFLYLEQLILKHNAHRDTISISERRDGLDFFFAQRAHAIKMTEFLASVAPVRTTASSQVISMDVHTSTTNYKFTYSTEIAPICKDDLVCLPAKVAKSLGNIGRMVICQRVTNSLRFLDPITLQFADLPAEKYFRDVFPSLCAIPELIEFLVLDIEPNGSRSANGKFEEADAQVSPMNAGSFGEADAVYHARTHLGSLLQPGDSVLGYHLRVANFNSPDFDALPQSRIPDVILVKKSYPDSKKRRKNRNWKLKSIAKEVEDNADEGAKGGKGALGRRGGLDAARVQKDYELFLRELEEDEELRAGVNLYRDPRVEEDRRKRREARARRMAEKAQSGEGPTPASADRMETDDAQAGDGADGDAAVEIDDGFTTDGESEFGEDVPRVPIDELIDEMDEMDIAEEV
ncbi:unnamed protein product [Tilletia controversa]|uniref:60S ribosomal export protein NMD3 n=3 Tax=Tilletia TaxID=13289 RepID=A0A8X7MMP6_9BASI|nr:hypothetical protein CF336_g6542 [Tilletia laevis]KAE8190033.1 hypothetical protein CF328_g6097 [Tilletia controversa]KAE8249011.1 hypothetical protein A4X03_0g6677 [Tilletia caries]KAE8194321.1 hypothetical protein CF335_g5372 [Tilletia laevis]KAE8242260.1 hypothetical protein A4X06_0g7077 [Tilletia controversa]